MRFPDDLLTAVGAPPLTVVFDGDVSTATSRRGWRRTPGGTPDGLDEVRAGEAIFSDGGAALGGAALCCAWAARGADAFLPSTLAVHAVTGPVVVEAVAGVPVNVTVVGFGVGDGAAADEAMWVRPGCRRSSPEDEVSSTAYIGPTASPYGPLRRRRRRARPLLSLR